MHFSRLAMVPILAVMVAGGATADIPKWTPHIDLEGKGGTDRNLGEADLFLPLAQNQDTLFFGNLRFRMDDTDSREGNFGLGLRHMLDSGWNLGGYGYFDRRRTEYGNYFHQGTFGIEALSMDWDFRANGYLPVGRTKHLIDSLSTVDFSGPSILYRQGEERALHGFDMEVGWRLPLFEPGAAQQLRAYAGGYRFIEDGVDNVQGPRGRLDLTFDSVPFLWEGSRLSVGAEIQRDDPRGTQGFTSLRLRIPLQNLTDTSKPRLTAMERRMTDPIIRDIDIVSQAGQFAKAEAITETADGKAITLVNSTTIASADLANALATAGANSTVVLNGSFTNVDSRLDVQNGQTVMGAGNLGVQTPSGRTVTIATPGASLAGEGAPPVGFGSPRIIFNMADNSSLVGVTVSTSGAGSAGMAVRVSGVDNVQIIGNTLNNIGTGNTSYSILVNGDAENTVIKGNVLTAIGDNALAAGLAVVGTRNLIFENNTINASGAIDNHLIFFNNTNIDVSGTGNSGNVNTCLINFGSTTTGSIGFTTATPTCP